MPRKRPSLGNGILPGIFHLIRTEWELFFDPYVVIPFLFFYGKIYVFALWASVGGNLSKCISFFWCPLLCFCIFLNLGNWTHRSRSTFWSQISSFFHLPSPGFQRNPFSLGPFFVPRAHSNVSLPTFLCCYDCLDLSSISARLCAGHLSFF